MIECCKQSSDKLNLNNYFLTGTNKEPQDTGQPHQGMNIMETKPSLIPMETDVISSEEDDILARESPDSLHKSPPTPHDAVMKVCVLGPFIETARVGVN